MPPEEDRYTAIGNTHKNFDKDRPCRSDREQTNTETDRHAHHNTHLPCPGRSSKATDVWCRTWRGDFGPSCE